MVDYSGQFYLSNISFTAEKVRITVGVCMSIRMGVYTIYVCRRMPVYVCLYMYACMYACM